LTNKASSTDGIVRFLVRPGDFVTAGDDIAEVHPPAAAPLLAPLVERHVDVGTHRTLDQDIEFAIDQIIEIALRAMSPAIDDTFTGLSCLDWLGAAMRSLAPLPVERAIWFDSSGSIRVVDPPRQFPGLVTAAFSELRQSAVPGCPSAAMRILEVIAGLGPHVTRPQDRVALCVEADMLMLQATRAAWAPKEMTAVTVRYRAVCEAMEHTPPPELAG